MFNEKIVTEEPLSLEKYLEEMKKSDERKHITGSALMIKLNGKFVQNKNIPKTILHKGDIISIFPLLGGG